MVSLNQAVWRTRHLISEGRSTSPLHLPFVLESFNIANALDLRSHRAHLRCQASGPGRWLLDQCLYVLASSIPTVLGIGVRGLVYRLILQVDG